MFQRGKPALLGLILGFWALVASAAQPLLTPQELQPLVQSRAVTVLDTRPPAAYAAGHIPGALSAPYAEWRGPAANPGALRSLEQFTALVQRLGLRPQTPVVVLYAGSNSSDFGSAARVYWTLKTLGAQELSILNGGVQAWKAAGLPLATEARAADASDWQPQINTHWLADQTAIQGLLGKTNAVLLDARPKAFFEGKVAAPAAHAKGTLPGAVDLDNAVFFAPGSAALLPTQQLAERAAAVDVQPGEETVSFCNTGHWAATNWFVLSEMLQRPGVRLYPESMVGWSSAPVALPMANTPGRGQQLADAFRTWADHAFSRKQ